MGASCFEFFSGFGGLAALFPFSHPPVLYSQIPHRDPYLHERSDGCTGNSNIWIACGLEGKPGERRSFDEIIKHTVNRFLILGLRFIRMLHFVYMDINQ